MTAADKIRNEGMYVHIVSEDTIRQVASLERGPIRFINVGFEKDRRKQVGRFCGVGVAPYVRSESAGLTRRPLFGSNNRFV